MSKMFCFQCEQTAGCSGCTGAAGVCGKKSDIALLQDKLTGALIGLARCTDSPDVTPTKKTDRLMILCGRSDDLLFHFVSFVFSVLLPRS